MLFKQFSMRISMEETFQNWISIARSYMYLFQMNLNLAKVLTYFTPYSIRDPISILNIGWLTFQIGNLWMILRRYLRTWSLILVNDQFFETLNIFWWNCYYHFRWWLLCLSIISWVWRFNHSDPWSICHFWKQSLASFEVWIVE